VNPTKDRLLADLANLNAQFERMGGVMQDVDGFKYLNADIIPGDMLDMYAHVTSAAYANGWL